MPNMQEPTFAILTSLACGPRHGYAIMTEVLDATGGVVKLKAGTLYGALERLRSDGVVEISSENVVHGRLRRSYILTSIGADLLRAEAGRRRAAADRALGRLAAFGCVAVAR